MRWNILTLSWFSRKNLIRIGECECARKNGLVKNMPSGKEAMYIVGNFVWTSEDSEEFGTSEKPWMNSRFVSYLPLKCEIQ